MKLVQVLGEVDPDLLAADLSEEFGEPVTVEAVRSGGELRLFDAPLDLDLSRVVALIEGYRSPEHRQIDKLIAKARRVWNGEDTFTQAQAQKILAGLVLLENRRR